MDHGFVVLPFTTSSHCLDSLTTAFAQCEMRRSHTSAQFLEDGPEIPKAVKKHRYEKGAMVQGRNEPVTLPRVAHVVAKIKDLPVEKVCEA